MARKPIEQQIAQLEARAKTLKARLARQDRARDTRRKILIGALVLHRLEHNGDAEFSERLSNWLRHQLPGFLSREDDKALFADLLSGKTDTAALFAESAKPETSSSATSPPTDD